MNEKLINDFETAGQAVLAYLHRRLGFNLWMITRTEGNDWIVLQTEDHGYGVGPGAAFQWADSFCSEMVKGNGPRIAPNSDRMPAYAAAPIGRQVAIKAYIGIPLTRSDGRLFGTLCAIDPELQPESIVDDQELLELLGAMLSTILQNELNATADARRTEKLLAQTLTDAMTNVYNRRGWDQLLAAEENRCRRHGHGAAVLVIDLNGLKRVNDTQGHTAGDALIINAAAVLQKTIRPNDIVARLGGDEFGLLIIECDRAGGETMLTRARAALADASIKASAGLAMRDPAVGLNGAWERADQQMYQEKHAQ